MQSRAALGAIVILGCAAMCARLAAQDVTVLPVDSLGSQERLDQLPVPKGIATPDFPNKLKKTTQIGWAEIEAYVSEDGFVQVTEAAGSLPVFESAARHAYRDVPFEPARRNGKPVAVSVRQVLLFNPASAAAGLPDATPRLLRASMIIDPERKVSGEAVRPDPEVVWVLAHIDASGRVAGVLAPTARLTKLIHAGLSAWSFAPARRGGVPEEATLRVPVILSAPGGLADSFIEPARVLSRVLPLYPTRALRIGLEGTVWLEFTVDTDGKAREFDIRRASSDLFASAAIKAIKKWNFAPALKDGTPVKSRFREAVNFRLEGNRGIPATGDWGATMNEKDELPKMPEAMRYDTAPEVWRLEQPKYPYALLANSAKGSAQIASVVAADGKVVASKVIHADAPEFGYALQAAVEQFRYEPATRDGDPSQTIDWVAHTFDPKSAGEYTIVSDAERAALRLELKSPESIARISELDEELKPTYAPVPAYPRSLRVGIEGDAIIEFLLGEDGRPLIPRVISASRPEFGYAAAHGVAKWRYPAPVRGGKPVVVRVRVPVSFTPPQGYPNEPRISVP